MSNSDLDARDLSYVVWDTRAYERGSVLVTEAHRNRIEAISAELEAEWRENKEFYETFAELRNEANTAYEAVLAIQPLASGSIQTESDRWESAVSALEAGDFEGYFEECYDSEKKVDAMKRFMASDLPNRVAEELRSGNPDRAQAYLMGRSPDTGDHLMETYLRVTKSAFALYLLGFDKITADTRVFEVMRPILECMLEKTDQMHPDTAPDNDLRATAPRMDAKPVPVISKSWFHDKLKWNIMEYDAVVGEVFKILAEETDIPPEILPQVAFNVGGDGRFDHKEVFETLE